MMKKKDEERKEKHLFSLPKAKAHLLSYGTAPTQLLVQRIHKNNATLRKYDVENSLQASNIRPILTITINDNEK